MPDALSLDGGATQTLSQSMVVYPERSLIELALPLGVVRHTTAAACRRRTGWALLAAGVAAAAHIGEVH